MSKDLLRRLLRSKNALLGLVVILSVSLVAICAPFFSPHDPYEQHLLERLKPPSLEHPFGHRRPRKGPPESDLLRG